VRESIRMITAAGATPCGVLIALDRQERATEAGADGVREAPWSAVQYVTQQLQLSVVAIATLDDLLQYLRGGADPALNMFAAPVQAYRERYGV
jgi:orotate phosphoribosyltransferase